MDAVLRINFDQEMDMVWHNFEFEQVGSQFDTNALDNLFKTGIHAADQDASAILRAPYNVVFAGVDNVIIRFVADGVR